MSEDIKNYKGLISVIVPVYNISPYINKCIESLIGQTYRELEIILVDDGSTDGSGEICDEYASKDSRIKVIHKPNGGLSDARNHGIDIARGEYLGFVDGDDWIHPQMYETMINVLLRDNADIVACSYERKDESFSDTHIDAAEFNTRILTGTQALLSIDDTIQAMAWNKLYRREVFGGIRYPVGRLNEDEFVIHELIYGSERIALIDEKYPLYFYTVREKSIMSRLTERSIFDTIDAIKARLDFCKVHSWSEVIPDVIAYFCNLCINRYYRVSNDLNASSEEKKRIMDMLWLEERDVVRTNKGYGIKKEYRKFAGSPERYQNYIKMNDVIGRFMKKFSGEKTDA